MGASRRSARRAVVLHSEIFPVAESLSYESSPGPSRRRSPKIIPFTPPPVFPVSSWTQSRAKRLMDVVCVLCAMPLVLPLLAITAAAVLLTSRGPVLFRQHRVGRSGRTFPILKFRTMPMQPVGIDRTGITTASNQRFTPIGPFLRRWKLDELPQLINVLRGEMSLVGPRPKLPCYETSLLNCRPGLTGFATMVFAREERAMSRVPSAEVDAYYSVIVKPFKRKLDEDYMARATLLSDLSLIFRSVFRIWGDVALTDLPPWIPDLASDQPITRRSASLGPEQVLATSGQ